MLQEVVCSETIILRRLLARKALLWWKTNEIPWVEISRNSGLWVCQNLCQLCQVAGSKIVTSQLHGGRKLRCGQAKRRKVSHTTTHLNPFKPGSSYTRSKVEKCKRGAAFIYLPAYQTFYIELHMGPLWSGPLQQIQDPMKNQKELRKTKSN